MGLDVKTDAGFWPSVSYVSRYVLRKYKENKRLLSAVGSDTVERSSMVPTSI